MHLQKFRLLNARGDTICLLIAVLLSTASAGIFAQTFTRLTPYLVELDAQAMAKWALNAPMEFTDQAKTKVIVLSLPLPGGEMVPSKIVESPVMVPKEAAKYPEIKTYAFQGLEDPTISGRLTLSPRGLDALMFTPGGDVFIEPDGFGNLSHKVYFMIAGDFPHQKDDRKFYPGYKHQHSPKEPAHEHGGEDELKQLLAYNIGAQLRNFNMHVIVDGEYSIAVCGASPTRNCVEAAITAALNSMNALYIRDMAMKLLLTNNTTIYLDPSTDPFADGGGVNDPAWQDESLTHHKTLITTDFDGGGPNTTVPLNTYDVAHLFSARVGNGSGGGGVAFLGIVCQDFELNSLGPAKAGGGSGVPDPQGAEWVGLLAHEFTHQYNADHTWNGTAGFCTPGQFGANSSYEPGSGSTIVSYSGICDANNIPNPGNINYYHTRSIEEANNYIAGDGNCTTATATGNDVPVPSTQTAACTPNYNIPIQTPFEITGSATDAQAGSLTFTWEQFDKGTRQDPIAAPQTTDQPLFRSFFPSASATRTIPQISTILSGNYNADQTAVALTIANWQGELLSEVARTINLRLTVRDNNIAGGGVEFADVAINVVGNTPFKTTSPNGGENVTAGTSFNVTWNVAGTTGAPINCANVTIKLSTDGGLTYPTSLGSFTNNGTASVTIPGGTGASSTARIRVECGTDCFKFFDISNANFTISAALPVELTQFYARPKERVIQLFWQTATELNNEGFEIQKAVGDAALEAGRWNILAFVEGNGNTNEIQNYSYTDERPQAGLNYFRLKQIDFDGNFKYSDVVSVQFAAASLELEIFPNPVRAGELTLYFPDPDPETLGSGTKSTIRLYDRMGRLALEQQTSSHQETLNVSPFPAGVYFVEVTAGGKVFREKVVVD